MIETLGDHSAMFMLFDPLTNKHYIMFQMGNGLEEGSTKFDITMPYIIDSGNDAEATTSIEDGDLVMNTATGSGQEGTAD